MSPLTFSLLKTGFSKKFFLQTMLFFRNCLHLSVTWIPITRKVFRPPSPLVTVGTWFQHFSVLSISLVVGTLGCAQPSPAPLEETPRISSIETSGTFEQLSPVKANDQFSSDLLKTPHYQILNEVTRDDMTYVYTIESTFGKLEARGEMMLRNRIREIQALIELENISSPEAFGTGVANTIMSPFSFLWDMATEPKDTAQSIPEGLSRTMNRMGEMFKGERGTFEESETKELLGFSLAKRQIAAHLGVDVYSSNPILQEKLTNVAWAAYAGGMGSRLLTIPVTGPLGFALMGTTFSATMNDLVRDSTPEDLRHLNRQLLLNMGAKEPLIEQFLNHPWYSPRHETVLVHALVEMTEVGHRGRFLEMAILAQSEEDALFFQQLAEMMANYHHSVITIDELLLLDQEFIVGFTTDHSLVAMLPYPRLLWTKPVAHAAAIILSVWQSMSHKVQRAELWHTGYLTTRARQELEDRGFMIHDQTLERLTKVQSLGKDPTMGFLFPRH